jgi:hypothetical protein
MLALVLLMSSACDRGNTAKDGCQKESDCPSGHCVAGACVMLENPLDASIPDLYGLDFASWD